MPDFLTNLEGIKDTSFMSEESAWSGLQALEKGELTGEAADAMRGNLQTYKQAMKERGNRYAFPTYEAQLADDEAKHYREVFAGPDRLRAIVGPDEVKVAEQDAGTSGKTADEVMQGNAAFGFLLDRTGIDEKTLSENLPGVMSQYGSKVLGVEGLDTTQKFYSAMQGHYENIDKQTAFAGRISEIAQGFASQDPNSKAGPMGVKGMSFTGLSEAWPKIIADPDYDPKNAALYKETFRKQYEGMNKALEKADPIAEKVLDMLQKLAQHKDESGDFVFSQDGIPGMMSAIGEVLKSGGIEETDKVKYLIAKRLEDMSGDQGGTARGMKRSIGRGLDDILVNLATYQNAPADKMLARLESGKDLWIQKIGVDGQDINDRMSLYAASAGYGTMEANVLRPFGLNESGFGTLRKLTPEERDVLKGMVEPMSKAADMVQFLKQARESSDPIKPDNKWIPDKVETGLFDAARSLPYTAASLLPAGLGYAIAGSSMAEDSFRQIMANNPGANRESARLTGDISGWSQAFIERNIDRAVLFGKSPKLGAVLTKLGISNGFARFGASVLAKSGAEFGEEKAQDFADAAARDIIQALNGDIGEFDWQKEWDSFSDAGGNLRTFLAVLPLSLVAAGKFSTADIKDGAKLTKSVASLKAIGIQEETAKTIAGEFDESKREQLLREAYKIRDFGILKKAGFDDKEADVISTETDQEKRAALIADSQAEKSDGGRYKGTQAAETVTLDGEGNPVEAQIDQNRQVLGHDVIAGEDGPRMIETRRDGLGEITEDDLLFERARESGTFPSIVKTEEGYRVEFPEGDEMKPMEVPSLDDATATVAHWMEATGDRQQAATTEWANWLELFHVEQSFDDKQETEMTAGMKVDGDPVKLAQLQERAALEGVIYNDRLRIFGESERVMQGKKAHWIARIFKGASPFDATEEFAEGFIKSSFASGDHSVEEVLGMLRQYEASSGTTVVKAVSTQGVIEAFSDMARGYVAGNIKSELIPPKMRAWFNTMVHFLGDAFKVTGQLLKFKADFERGNTLKETKEAGGLDPKFEGLLKQATGMDMGTFERRMMQEAADMDGLHDPDKELSKLVRGLLPRPSDVVDTANGNFRGELAQIWDALSKEAGGTRRKDGRKKLSGSKANAFFALPGQGMNLDDLRQKMNENGFNFETPDEMLVAISDSVNGREQFGSLTQFNEGEIESHSIGLAEEGGGPEDGEKQPRQYELVNESAGYWSGVMKERRVMQRMVAGHVVELAPKEELDKLKAHFYETMPKGVTLDAAKKAIANAGTMENAVLSFMDDSNAIHPRVKVLMGGILRKMALERKTDAGYDMAAAITDRLAEVATQGGQVIEAFKYLGSGFGTTEGALAWVKRQVKKAAEKTIPKEMVDNVRAAVGDVMKEANKLFNGWMNEALGIKDTKARREEIDGYRLEDIPDITFSLDPSLEGLVPWAVETMRTLGADAVDSLLMKKYGDRIKPHLADVKIEAMKKLQTTRKPHKPKDPKRTNPEPRPETVSQPSGDPVPFEDRKQGEMILPGEKVEPATPDGENTDEQKAAWEAGKLGPDLAGFHDLLVQRALDKLKIKNIETPRQAREAIDGVFKQIVGAKMTPEQTAETIEAAFAEKFKAPKMTAAMVKGTEEFAQRIARTPEVSVARRQATLDFMNFVHDSMAGVDWLEVAWSVWYANTLSGYGTHIKNIGDTGLQVMADTLLSALHGNPMNWLQNIQQAAIGMKEGFGTGFAEAGRHIKTGQSLVARESESKFGASNILDRKTFMGGKINPFNWLKYVPRLLVAEDYVQYAGAMEAKARLIALEMARHEGLKGDALSAKVEMILNKSPERIVNHTERAAAEWEGMQPGDYTGTKAEWMKRRVAELSIMEREGDLLERSSDFAARATYNYKPEGHIGAFAEAIGQAFAGMQRDQKPGDGVGMKVYSALSTAPRLMMPFVRIVANVLNKQLDYTPVGLIRSAFAETVERQGTQKVRKVKSTDQRAMEIKKGIIGTALLAGLLLRKPDDEDNWFDIHGAGPSDYNKANQLRATGWMPNSIQLGGKFISYKNTPLGVLFSVMGNYYDSERYDEGHDNDSVLMKVAFGLTDAAQVILDQSFLSNMSDFFQIMGRKGEATTKALERFLSRTVNPAQMVPFANLWRQGTADIDTKMRDKKGMLGDLAAMTPVTTSFNKPKLDALGDDIESRTLGWLWSAEKKGEIEPRIWRMVADKKAWFSNTWQYSSKMEPDQFYRFQQVRGQTIKASLMANDGRLLRAMEGMPAERAQERMHKLCLAATKAAKRAVGFSSKED